MQRFAQILGAGALALALIAGGSSALVAHAEEMTIQGEGYIGYRNDISSSSGGSSSGTTSTSSSGGSSTPDPSSGTGSSSGVSTSSGAATSSGAGSSSSTSASSGAATSSGGTDTPRPAESTATGQGGGGSHGGSGGQGGGTNAGGASSRVNNTLLAGGQMAGADDEEPEELEESAEEDEADEELPAEELPNDTIELEDGEMTVPLTSLRGQGWGVVNLFLVLLALGAAAYLFAVTHKRQNRVMMGFVSGALGLLPIVLFALLEDFGTVRVVTRWTPLFIAMTLIYLTVVVILQVKSSRPDTEQ